LFGLEHAARYGVPWMFQLQLGITILTPQKPVLLN